MGDDLRHVEQFVGVDVEVDAEFCLSGCQAIAPACSYLSSGWSAGVGRQPPMADTVRRNAVLLMV